MNTDFLGIPKQYVKSPQKPKTKTDKAYLAYLNELAAAIEQNYHVFKNNYAIEVPEDNERPKAKKLIALQEAELMSAEQVYFELTGKEFKTQWQKQVDEFNNLLPYLRRITYCQQAFGPSLNYLYIIDDDNVIELIHNSLEMDKYHVQNVFNKTDLIRKLRTFNIGHWDKENNLPELVMIEDGTSWNMTFEFAKGKRYIKKSFYGYMSWPLNFEDVADSLQIDF